ncbi:MAG: phage terminase large subunit, partial [Oscillospiraceae bacterium]
KKGTLVLTITQKQYSFIQAKQDEVLFGGAAGGGKSYGQLADALLYAVKYPGSKQLILRCTFPDLERSLILEHLALYPQNMYRYGSTAHRGRFKNGSMIEFGYCDAERDVYRYQGAEYDVIRFDELTHFTEEMYVYLISRLRGANDFPKQIKSTTNPGGIGHQWVKRRFVDPAPAAKPFTVGEGSRVFIPSFVQDNVFLMQKDPDYIKRLERLDKKDRDALLHGSWELFEGQFFTEWNRKVHVAKPFIVPPHWRRYICMDYGLDIFACYWMALDAYGRAWAYREIYTGKDNGGQGVLPSEAAQMIRAHDDKVDGCIAPPDLWNRQKDTGRSIAEIFAEHGVYLRRADNSRVQGWLNLKEALRVQPDEHGKPAAGLRVFENCVNLIRTLPALQYNPDNPCDIADRPHELTHAPDALRYFFAGRPAATARPLPPPDEDMPKPIDRQVQSFLDFGG